MKLAHLQNTHIFHLAVNKLIADTTQTFLIDKNSVYKEAKNYMDYYWEGSASTAIPLTSTTYVEQLNVFGTSTSLWHYELFCPWIHTFSAIIYKQVGASVWHVVQLNT